MTEKVQLTEQEQMFVDILFDGQVMRNPEEAKLLAGYPRSYPVLKIIKRVSETLIQKYDDYLTLYASKGIAGLMDVLDSPETPGSAIKLKAVIELLDRAGVVKKEKTEVASNAPSYIFFLPQKNSLD